MHFTLEFVKILLENEQFVTPGSATLILSHFSSHLILLEPGLVVLYEEVDGVALAEEGGLQGAVLHVAGDRPNHKVLERGSGVGHPDSNQYLPLPCLLVSDTKESS